MSDCDLSICSLCVFSHIAILPGWGLNATRFIPYYILPNQNTTLIDPVHICGNDARPILLLIIVCSSARNFEARQAIRDTWANMTEFNYPAFHRIHAKMTGKYLDFNYEHYQYYLDNNNNNNYKSNNNINNHNNQHHNNNYHNSKNVCIYQIALISYIIISLKLMNLCI